MPRYYREHCAVFCRTRDTFGELSNLNNRFPLNLGDCKTISSENLYQALRFSEQPALQRMILAEPKPMGSKFLAYQPEHILHTHPDWLNGMNLQAMRLTLRLKYRQHRDRLDSVFAQTDSKPIVELSNKDPFWGAKPQPDGSLYGENQLGLMWNELHDRYYLPADPVMPEFGDLTVSPALKLFGQPVSDFFSVWENLDSATKTKDHNENTTLPLF